MSEAIRQEKKVLELEWREDEIKQSIKDHQQKLKDNAILELDKELFGNTDEISKQFDYSHHF